MKKLAIISILSLLISNTFANEEIIRNSHFNYIETVEKTYQVQTERQIEMTIVLDVDSKWAQNSILERELAKTQRSLGVCGIGIDKLEIIKVSLTQKFRDQILVNNPYLGLPEIPIAVEGLPERKLLGILYQKIKPYGSAFAINLSSVLRSERTSQFPSYRPLLGTYWISEDNNTYENTPDADETYSTLAHEVVHIMGDLGHVHDNTSRNLMSSSDHVGKSYALTEDQCSEIIGHFF